MQPWTLPRVRGRTVARTAAVAAPVLAGLAAAALMVAAPSAAVPAYGIAVVTDPVLVPVVAVDRDGLVNGIYPSDVLATTP